MKKLVFISQNSIKETYDSLLHKYRAYRGITDILKISVYSLVIILSLFVYLYFINKSSTQGYFLRQENNNLNSIKFKHEIMKTQILNQKQNNREQLHNDFASRDRVINVSASILPSTNDNL